MSLLHELRPVPNVGNLKTANEQVKDSREWEDKDEEQMTKEMEILEET